MMRAQATDKPIASPANERKIVQLHGTLENVLTESLQRGFHGKASVEFSVQDGTIQQIVWRTERLER